MPTYSVGTSGSCSAAPLTFVCWCLLVVLLPYVVHRCIHLRLLPCLHLSSQLCLVVCPSCLVGCHISQRLSLSLLSHLCLAWRLGLCHSLCLNLSLRPSHSIDCCIAQRLNLHLVATLPGALVPLVDPSLMTAFGVVCHCSRQRICPVQRHLPQSRRLPKIAVSDVIAMRVHRQHGASFAVAVAAGILACIRCQRRVTPAVARRARPLPGHGPKEGASPSR